MSTERAGQGRAQLVSSLRRLSRTPAPPPDAGERCVVAGWQLGADGRNDAASMIFDPDEGLADMILGHDAPDRMAGEGQAA